MFCHLVSTVVNKRFFRNNTVNCRITDFCNVAVCIVGKVSCITVSVGNLRRLIEVIIYFGYRIATCIGFLDDIVTGIVFVGLDIPIFVCLLN